MMADETTNLLLLDDYVLLRKAAEQPDMPSYRTLQRWAAQRVLPGLVYFGQTPMLHIQRFREGLAAREVPVVGAPSRRYRRK